ncbi:MAG: hypothetical protein IPJ65_15315 [Archangiaceae bacterium]|nr:hypothetical protein [Archangiaceae bacterium]
MLKLLHTADWHLGRRFRAFSEEASIKLSRARLEVIDRIFSEAERHQVDAVLCARVISSTNPSQARVVRPRGLAPEEAVAPARVSPARQSPDAQTNFPISKDAVVDRGLDYLAIGDTHGFRFIPPERKQPPTIYPGTPEPTAFDEVDPGHVALVLINRQRRATVDKRRVANWHWETVRVAELSALRALAARHDLGNRVLRLTVEMRLSAEQYDEAEALLQELAGTEARHGRAGVLQLDREGLSLDVAALGHGLEGLPPVLQAAARRLQEAAADPDQRPAAERALFHLFRAAREGVRG